MSLISLIRIELPWGITITNVWLVLFQNDSVNSTYVIVGNPIAAKFVLISVVILALVLISILGICRKSKEKDFQSYIKKYLSYALVSVLFSGGVIWFGLFPIVNYSFDTTETQIVEVTVIEDAGNDSLMGSFFDFHELYNIDTADDIQIDQISIDTDYKIDLNIRIPIMYRKGLFCEIYKVDYSYLDDAGY